MIKIFRHLKLIALLLCLLIIPDSAYAQFNIGPQFAIPVSGIEESFEWGLGGGFLMEIPISKSVSLVGQFDFMHWVKNKKQEEKRRLGHAGFQAGVRLYPGRKVYVQGWGGAFGVSSDKTFYDPKTGQGDSEYGWAIGAGYLPSRRTDLGLRLQSIGLVKFLALKLDYRLDVKKKDEYK